MSDSGKRIFAAASISSSLDTVLATTLNTNYHNNRLKKSNPNLISDKSLSNNSSKSSSGSSLTLTNNNNNNNSSNLNHVSGQQYPHHQFYQTQISTSANWNNLNIRSGSICSQKVSEKFQLDRVEWNYWKISWIIVLRHNWYQSIDVNCQQTEMKNILEIDCCDVVMNLYNNK